MITPHVLAHLKYGSFEYKVLTQINKQKRKTITRLHMPHTHKHRLHVLFSSSSFHCCCTLRTIPFSFWCLCQANTTIMEPLYRTLDKNNYICIYITDIFMKDIKHPIKFNRICFILFFKEFLVMH